MKTNLELLKNMDKKDEVLKEEVQYSNKPSFQNNYPEKYSQSNNKKKDNNSENLRKFSQTHFHSL